MLRRDFLTGAAALPFATPLRAQTGSKGTLRFVPRSDLTILDPVVTTDYATRNHGLLVWDQLYGLDGNLQPQPQMVQGHTVEDDGKRWTFRLRDGLRFHDGEPVRGRDCVASIRRWAQRDALGQALLARTTEMTSVDDKTFAIRLTKPYRAMLDSLAKLGPPALLIMPERLAATDPAKQITEIIGSGPFLWKEDERIVGARVVYERNRAYQPRQDGVVSWCAGPKVAHVDRVEWIVMPDAGTAAVALQNGEVDWWESPNNDLLPLLTGNPGIVTQKASSLGDMATGVFNQLHPPFDKPAVRRIVLEALSQQEFMTAIAGADPEAWRADVGVFTPGSAMASNAGLQPSAEKRRPEMLKAALLEAGYHGERVLLMAPSDKPALTALGEVANDLLRRLGMNVDYFVADWGTIVQRRANKAAPEKGGWSMFSTTWAGLDMTNPAVTQVLRTSGSSGFFGWPNIPSITMFVEAWLDAPDADAQKRICEAIQLAALSEVPFLPLGQFFSQTAYRRSLANLVQGQFVFWNVSKS